MIDDLLHGWKQLQAAAPGYQEAEAYFSGLQGYVEAEFSYVEAKTCPGCGESKDLSEFYAKTSRCKVCSAAKQRDYLASPEGREKRLQWSRERARKAGLAEHHMVRPGDTSRPCSECGEVKDFSEFYTTRTGNPAAKCKVCVRARGRERAAARSPEEKDALRQRNMAYRHANPERAATWRREWVEKNPDRWEFLRSDNYYRSRYNLTLAQVQEILEQQGGKCAACSEELTKFQVDHDHSCCSGVKACNSCVRGLLCPGCNAALGHARDDVDRLMGMAAYLLRSKSVLDFDGSGK